MNFWGMFLIYVHQITKFSRKYQLFFLLFFLLKIYFSKKISVLLYIFYGVNISLFIFEKNWCYSFGFVWCLWKFSMILADFLLPRSVSVWWNRSGSSWTKWSGFASLGLAVGSINTTRMSQGTIKIYIHSILNSPRLQLPPRLFRNHCRLCHRYRSLFLPK